MNTVAIITGILAIAGIALRAGQVLARTSAAIAIIAEVLGEHRKSIDDHDQRLAAVEKHLP